MKLSECYKKRIVELAGISNSNVVTKEKIYSDVMNFVKGNFYSDVNYEHLLNSCDLAKGNCADVTEDLEKYLLSIGYSSKDVVQIDLYNPKFDLSQSHSEWQEYEPKYLFHVVLKVGKFFVDLTGSQFSPEQSGIKIYTKDEISKLWNNFKIMRRNSDGYFGKIKTKKF